MHHRASYFQKIFSLKGGNLNAAADAMSRPPQAEEEADEVCPSKRTSKPC